MLELQFDESPLFDLLVAAGLPPRENGQSTLPDGTGLGVRLDARLFPVHLDSTPRVWEAP